jgi:MoaA/NifB/PqqE/SkfB family radical SAM enzyme
VHLAVTARCDALCSTCAVPLRKVRELATDELVTLLDGLAARGVARVVLGGGEPLVREDLGVLVGRCVDHGIFCQVETNGYRYPARAAELDGIGELILAWEGPEAVHDAQREPGSWARARAALEAARARGVPVRLRATLTRHNVDHVEAIVDAAEAHGAVAEFQLLRAAPLVTEAQAAALSATPEALRAALRRILEARQAGRPVANPEKVLRYLLAWGDLRRATDTAPRGDLHCLAGELFVAVDPDGTMSPCPAWSRRFPGRDVRAGLDAAFEAARDHGCRACTDPVLTEYNYLYNLNAPLLVERLCATLARRPSHGLP